jgi:hypothetical protein
MRGIPICPTVKTVKSHPSTTLVTFDGFGGYPNGCVFHRLEANLTDYLALRKELLTKTANPFEGFEGDLDGCDSANSASPLALLISALATLEGQCPDLVSVSDWQQAVDDGREFIVQWGKQAEVLGWTAEDLFSLADVPERPAANYRRLSRYDAIGLIWLLHGRPVVTLTASSAVIGRMDGPTFYRHPQARQVTP